MKGKRVVAPLYRFVAQASGNGRECKIVGRGTSGGCITRETVGSGVTSTVAGAAKICFFFFARPH